MNDTAAVITINIDDCWNRIGVWRRGQEICPILEKVIHCRNCEHYSAAGQKILQREIPSSYREEWTRVIAAQKQCKQPNTESIVIFRLGDEWLSIPSPIVREITSSKPIRRLPHTRRNIVKGLVNMRGELQICISLGGLLDLDKGELPRRFGSVGIADRMILISNGEHQFVFPVTEVHGLHRHHPSELQAVPATLSKSKATYTRGVLHWNDEHVACLDAELMFHTLSRSLA
jgi:chemotaxis-related protein WspD